MSNLKEQLIRLGAQKPELQTHLSHILDALPKVAAAPAEVQGFIRDIESAFRKHFPKGYFHAKSSSSLGSNGIYIATATLPKGQQNNGIIQNDPSYNTFWMHDSWTEEGGLEGRLKLEMSQGGTVKVDRDFERVGWRNTTAKPSTIVRKLDSYFGKIKDMLR